MRKRLPVIAWTAAVAAAFGAPWLLAAPAEPTPGARPEPAPYFGDKPGMHQLSSASCASDSCHGGAVNTKGGENTTWAAEAFPGRPSDPHARAYRVLFNEVSVRIGQSLKLTPHTDAQCLACHAVPETAREGALDDGVGCGGCHGPAERWNAAHVHPGWKGLTAKQKFDGYGFAPTKSLVGRALGCAGCHVGDETREVDHKLLAAGHPRLSFEAAQMHFHTGYGKHWVEKTRPIEFEVRDWVAGQAATMRAATHLLGVRAERATKSNDIDWPELSGHSCYACHQKVGVGADTGSAFAAPSNRNALAGWEVYAGTGIEVAAEFTSDAFAGIESPKLPALGKLRKEMDRRAPDPKSVAKLAAASVREFDGWLAELQRAEDAGRLGPLPPDLPRRLAHELAKSSLTPDRQQLADADWDALAARYLGCAAMYHASGGKAALPGWGQPLRDLAGKLAFPTDSKGVRFDGPAELRAARGRILADFRTLHDATAPTVPAPPILTLEIRR